MMRTSCDIAAFVMFQAVAEQMVFQNSVFDGGVKKIVRGITKSTRVSWVSCAGAATNTGYQINRAWATERYVTIPCVAINQ